MKLIRRNEFVIEASPGELADLLLNAAGLLAPGTDTNRRPAEPTTPGQVPTHTRASRDVLLAHDVYRVLTAREEGRASDSQLLELLAYSWRQHQNG